MVESSAAIVAASVTSSTAMALKMEGGHASVSDEHMEGAAGIAKASIVDPCTVEDQPSSAVKDDTHTSDDFDDDADDDAVPSNKICVDNREGETDLIQAVRLNHCDKIRQLIRSGINCDDLCKLEGAPCMVRVERGDFRKHLQMVGYAPLHVAVIHSSLKTVRCLLTLGADVNIRDKNQRTPLQLSAAVNRPQVAGLLISSGAEINTRSLSGRSPLMEAVTNLSLDLTRSLLTAGANADLSDIKGTTPLCAVISSMAGSPLQRSLDTSHSIVQSLLDAGCEVDRRNLAGATALMLASGMKVTPVIPMLVAAGANVNLADRAGCTSFNLAIEGQRNLTAITQLMKHGAATHVADNKGQTPLSKALKYGAVAILRLLLSADAVPHTYEILTAPRIVQLQQYLPEFDAWLRKELYEPRSLMRLCREVVRVRLSPHNLPHVERLGLPRTLNDFVLGVSNQD
ncbi:hypothetical protein ACOMHN_035728 [Nucella lapillus]